MTDVFISYSADDEAAVQTLATDLERAGQTVWLDREPRGGEAWWANILERIKQAGIVVLALSESSQRSKACRLQLGYAQALGIPIVPVRIGPRDGPLTTPLHGPIADLDVLDYRRPDTDAANALIAALADAATRRAPLPDPPPEPPPDPLEYLRRLGRALDAPRLAESEQAGILAELRRALKVEDDAGARRNIGVVLSAMRRRPEVSYPAVQEIDALLATTPRPAVTADPQPAATPTAADDVQFTVFRPDPIRPERWHPLLAFAHRTTSFVDPHGVRVDPLVEVARQARALLGAAIDEYRQVGADSLAALPYGNEIVFEPWLDTAEFNPTRHTVRWEEPVHPAEFRVKVPWFTDGWRLNGGLRVYLGVLLIGDVRFAVRVSDAAPAAAPEIVATSGRRYTHIFASYSPRDLEIVQRIAATVALTGDRYLIDVHERRSGELWGPRLAELIDAADVFQLFWSRNSMRSAFVRREWEHALGLGREEFVRPVYWERPMPSDPTNDLPPARLRRYRFGRLIEPAGVGGPVGGTAAPVAAPSRPTGPAADPPMGTRPARARTVVALAVVAAIVAAVVIAVVLTTLR